MDVFKFLLADGQESRTGRFWVDSSGKDWPIYRKKVAIAAFANAGSINVAHGVPTIKLNAPFTVVTCFGSNAGNTVRVNTNDARITNIVLTDVTNIAITNTTDLSAVAGSIEFEFCKTTD